MGVVRTLSWRAGAPTVGEAVAAFLATLDHPETVGTRRVYASTLRQLRAHLGPEAPVAVLDDPAAVAGLAGWFTGRWGPAAPATFNRNLDALRSAAGYWRDQGWIASDPTRAIRRRGRARDRTRALSRAVVDELDLRNRCAKVRRKGNAVDIIVWRTGAARLLPRMLKGRTTGPVFLTDRRARLMLPPGDLDPVSGRARLSYRRAAELFTAATGGATLHQLRHSALTHAAEDGANTSTLLSYSGHTSVASLARYARVSPEALARWQAGRDPAARRR